MGSVVRKKSTGSYNKRKSMFAPDDTVGKIEYHLAKALGKNNYTRPVERFYEKGSFNFGGEVAFLKLGDDDKSVFVSPEADDDNTYVPIDTFIADQRKRFEKDGAPPTAIPLPEEPEEKAAFNLQWFDLAKQEEKEKQEAMKAGVCGKFKVFRKGNTIVPIEATTFDTIFATFLTIVRAAH